MTDQAPTSVTNLDRYGFDSLPWSRAHAELAKGSTGPDITHFLGTIRPDGRPHVAGVGAAWFDGDLYFTSNRAARKARNLAANPACTLAVKLAGIDLTLEGTAVRVADGATLAGVAAIYRAAGWPAEVTGDALTAPFSAPSAGPPPWHLFRFTFHTCAGWLARPAPGLALVPDACQKIRTEERTGQHRGSNSPMELPTPPYRERFAAVSEALPFLDAEERSWILGRTALSLWTPVTLGGGA